MRCDTIGQKENALLRSFMTKDRVNKRAAYARYSESRIRIASFFGLFLLTTSTHRTTIRLTTIGFMASHRVVPLLVVSNPAEKVSIQHPHQPQEGFLATINRLV